MYDGIGPSRDGKNLSKRFTRLHMFHSKNCGDDNVIDKMNIDAIWHQNSHIEDGKGVIINSVDQIGDIV